jgi:hypothetical protein
VGHAEAEFGRHGLGGDGGGLAVAQRLVARNVASEFVVDGVLKTDRGSMLRFTKLIMKMRFYWKLILHI